MIFDLSCPHGQCVKWRHRIPREFGTLQYESFQQALHHVAQAGSKQISKQPSGESASVHSIITYSSSSGKGNITSIWTSCSVCAPLQHVRRRNPLDPRTLLQLVLSHYVDDFLRVFPAGTKLVEESKKFDGICANFGFPTEPSKDEMRTRVNHLGFEVDTSQHNRNTLEEQTRSGNQAPLLPH